MLPPAQAAQSRSEYATAADAPSPVTGLLGRSCGIPCGHCGAAFSPRQDNQRFCSARCYDRAYNKRRPVVRQARIVFDPPPVVPPTTPRAHTPQHNPARQPGLQRACYAILELLSDGQLHAWHALQVVGGSRAAARVSELRKAGHVVLGPRPWLSPTLERVPAIELGAGGVECYRLLVRA